MMMRAYGQAITPEKQNLNSLQEISMPEYLAIIHFILFIRFTPFLLIKLKSRVFLKLQVSIAEPDHVLTGIYIINKNLRYNGTL
jgi:hypothetical protein